LLLQQSKHIPINYGSPLADYEFIQASITGPWAFSLSWNAPKWRSQFRSEMERIGFLHKIRNTKGLETRKEIGLITTNEDNCDLKKGGDNIAKKSSGPKNGPSKTGNPSGKGRGNNPSKK
jgi:hypothetical protein